MNQPNGDARLKNLSPSPSGKPRRWWFGQTRTLEQQLTGLEDLLSMVNGRSILDVGAAEGAISIRCAQMGARAVYGIEIVPEFVEQARKDAFNVSPRSGVAGFPVRCTFVQGDANTWAPDAGEQYDIVLMLAILQKLRDPSAACKRIARCARELVVIRLPPGNAPVIIDQRSGMRPHDIEHAMREAGFYLAARCDGPVAEAGVPEQTLYFARADRD